MADNSQIRIVYVLLDGVGDLPHPDMYAEFVDAGDIILDLYKQRQYHLAMRQIMALADRANQYIAESKPWEHAKHNEITQMTGIITQALNLYRILILYLSPVIPETARLSQAFMHDDISWDNRATPLLNHTIAEYKHLLSRIETSMCPQND